MKTIKYCVICYQVFGGAERETDIIFSKPEDAQRLVNQLNKKARCYYYKEVSKKCFQNLEEYNELNTKNSKIL